MRGAGPRMPSWAEWIAGRKSSSEGRELRGYWRILGTSKEKGEEQNDKR